MKKLRMTAFFTAICLTAVFYTACGGSDENYLENYDNSVKQVAPQKTQGSVPEMADEAEDMEGGIDYNTEEYSKIAENGFVNTSDETTSTFSIDVDTASYANVRRMLQDGYYDNIAEAVRIEEMINYFNYSYPAPEDDAPFSVTTEVSPCPWNSQNQLMLVGLQADKLDLSQRTPMNLVFLIDVSGSMYGEDRLGLVQKAVHLLAENLNENDRISIVTYAGAESVVLEGTPGNETSTITDAIDNLFAGGSTAGEAGIRKAYQIAEENFIQGGNNRILLATDGDLNVGISSEEELKSLVEKERETGVNLSVLGFGSGNLKDNRLETLADNGNGNYSYIDSLTEAKKVLVSEMGGTFYTVAKDVKLQLEFDPATVQSYRLIGYENRVLANEDFDNDAVDAGEIGAGHSVTALYELVPTESQDDHIMKLAMRYKQPDGNESMLKEFDISKSASYSEQIQRNSAFAGAVAEFGMLLRNSTYAGNSSYTQITDLLSKTDMQDEYRAEFRQLADMAYRAGLLPETTATVQGTIQETTAPVPDTEQDTVNETDTEQDTVPETETERSTAGTGQGVDFTMTAYQQGNQIDFPEPESFIELTEKYLDSHMQLKTIPDDTFAQKAKETGTYLEIQYSEDIYGAIGKQVQFQNTEKPFYLYGMKILSDGESEQLWVNNGGTEMVYAVPEIVRNELQIRLKTLENN